tara:strand:+ start:854 stop:1270 length:417 start_codon:yes stop_codon:yes gene_type:complete
MGNLFDTKITIILLSTLEVWQKLNVTAFLTSGIVGSDPRLIGEAYCDKSERTYLPLNRQPIVVLEADLPGLQKINQRAVNRSVCPSIYIEDMFSTGNDEDNRKTVLKYHTTDLPIVGIGLREDRKLVDKITKGAKLHP